eukprot:8371217-Pyramimonas_sp.AAC.1
MLAAKVEPNVISYNAGVSACKQGKQWQRALALLSEMRESELEPNVISYNAGISACETGEQWQRALALLSKLREAKVEPDVICTTLPGIMYVCVPEGSNRLPRDAVRLGAQEAPRWPRALTAAPRRPKRAVSPRCTKLAAGCRSSCFRSLPRPSCFPSQSSFQTRCPREKPQGCPMSGPRGVKGVRQRARRGNCTRVLAVAQASPCGSSP